MSAIRTCPVCGATPPDLGETVYQYGCGPRCHPNYWRCKTCGYVGWSLEDRKIRERSGLDVPPLGSY